MEPRRQRVKQARLYLVCDTQTEGFLHAALQGGVDMVQLRMKGVSDEEILTVARRFRTVCSHYGALLILNDRPDLVIATGADGVHVGQDDVPVARARELVGPERLVGLSTHSPEQVDSATDGGGERGADYIGVGPVYETPTKPGRPAVGLELVRYAAQHATVPFFAIGGISTVNVAEVLAPGGRRVAVARAVTEAPDPERAARELKEALGSGEREEAPVGAA